MPTIAETTLDAAALARALKEADPAVLLVPSRILRRVIKRDHKLGMLGLQVPHHKSYVVSRTALLQHVDPQELGFDRLASLPESVILLEVPDPAKLAKASPGEALVKYWRRLFHSRIHIAVEDRFAEEGVTDAGLRRRIQRLGLTAFQEVRSVLQQERYLLPPEDDRATYVEFAAVYLELRYFAPHLLGTYFPTLKDRAAIDALLAEDVDAGALFHATRPAGVFNGPDPSAGAPCGRRHDEGRPPLLTALSEDDPRYSYYLERANQTASVGNVVRAAILKTWAGLREPGADPGAPPAGAELDQLTRRLKAALELTDQEAAQWRRSLAPLLVPAAHGFRAPEARLLYDLQKVCLDHERGIYSVDIMEWLLSLGRHPIKRELPGQKDVLAVKRLRRVANRLRTARISEDERCRLVHLVEVATAHSEERLRVRFRPLVAGCFDKVGLTPENLPGAVARDKMVEELLDEIVERGFATVGDVRDSLSRNQLKLPDLSGPGEFLMGDQLILLNRELALSLDGVYHRGEVYLRLLQRFSSLGFGTAVGRFLTRYVFIPFGGAFVALMGLEHLVTAFARVGGWEPPLDPHGHGPSHEPYVDLTTYTSVGLLGLFLLLLLNVRPFRSGVSHGLWFLGTGLHRLFIDVPAWVLRLPPVQAVFKSWPMSVLLRYLLRPILVTAGAAGLGLYLRLPEPDEALLGGFVFVMSLVLWNTSLGRDLDEMLTDLLVRGWRRLSIDVVPAIFHLTVEVFQQFLEIVQRLLYRIDEWLRFRSGESRLSLAAKAVGGVFWFFITYVVRFAVNVLIEPQVNPIKHFPVVTVSHKLVWTLAISIAPSVAAATGWTVAYTLTMLTGVAWAIPGLFGFVAWELKENWFLYRANRSPRLKPVAVGHHGETVLRLLKLGFHSGTLPRLYARLRRAERKGQAAEVLKYRQGLHQAAEAVCHFVEREFVNLLHRSKSWADTSLRVGKVGLDSNRIDLELVCPALPGSPLWLRFDEEGGSLLAGVAEPGWLRGLSPARRGALATALAGLYKLANVAVVREQVASCLPAGCHAYELDREGLTVWLDADCETAAVYPLDGEGTLQPLPVGASKPSDLPALSRAQVLFGEEPITWQRWVELWEQDQAGKELPEQPLPGVRLLPAEGGG